MLASFSASLSHKFYRVYATVRGGVVETYVERIYLQQGGLREKV
jgi:hypothetical protein